MISAALLVSLMIWYQLSARDPGALVPLFMALAFAAAFGAGLWISALMVRYRDFRFIVPFVVQFGLYISPVGFSSTVVPEKWRFLYSLNPMVGVIDGFRWAILGGEHSILLAGISAFPGGGSRPGLDGNLVLPEDRAWLRGCDLTAPGAGRSRTEA